MLQGQEGTCVLQERACVTPALPRRRLGRPSAKLKLVCQLITGEMRTPKDLHSSRDTPGNHFHHQPVPEK